MKNSKQHKTVSILKGFALSILLSIGLFSCDSEEDVNFDAVIDPCESAVTFGINTYDPWSGASTLFANVDFGSEVDTAPSIGGPVTYSNASTYNFDDETYHFFNTSNNVFVNIINTMPATMVPLVGPTPGSTYSHIVYIKGVDTYYIIEKSALDQIILVEVNPFTGVLGANIPTGFFETIIDSISITTNNADEAYIMINRTLISVVNLSGVPSASFVEVEDAFSTTNLFYGIEYNVSSGFIDAIRLEKFADVINLVEIDLDGTFSTLFSLTADITNKGSIIDQFYSTTLSCKEDLYRITYLAGNNNTIYHTIDRVTGEVLTDTFEANYYFGIESNANN